MKPGKRNGTFNESVGNYLSRSIQGNELLVKTYNAQVNFSSYGNGVVRIRISPQGKSSSGFSYARIDRPQNALPEIFESETSFWFADSQIRVQVEKYPLRISIYSNDGTLLSADDPAFGTSWIGNEITTYKTLQPGERFLGLGEKTGPLDRRGKSYVNWNTDNFAYGSESDPLYLSTPFYLGLHSEKVYGIFFDNSHKTRFNFGSSNNRFSFFQAENGEMDYFFFHSTSVAGILENYTHLTGRNYLPPIWSLGFQQCRYSYYPDTEILTLARTFREKKIPADVIYLDIHYMDAYKVFSWDGKRFSDPGKMLKQLREMGFRVVVILDPGIKKEEAYHMYEEGKSKGYFVTYPDGEEYLGEVWPGWSAFPDFTKPEVREWWGEKLSGLAGDGITGFWNDMNEPATWGQCMPDLMEFDYEGEGATHKKARNVYGMQMARSTFEGARRHLKGERPFVLTRAGYSGIQRYAAVWTGDNVSSDEHMLLGQRLVNSLGLTGISFAGNDIGGFAGEASPELYARWIALAAFNPLFRAHSMINSRDAEPWSFGEEVEDIARNYINLRYRLMPYLYSLFDEHIRTGMPVCRSLAIDYTFDPMVYQDAYQNEFLFGPSLLVVPVSSNDTLHEVYLPKGKWHYLFNDRMAEGPAEEFVKAGKELIPLFVKAGSVLLMQQKAQNSIELLNSSVVEVHIYPGTGEFTYYEDDGLSYAYEKGEFLRRKFTIAQKSLTVNKSEGNFKSRYKRIRFYIHGPDVGSDGFRLNGNSVLPEFENYRFIEPVSSFDPFNKSAEIAPLVSAIPVIETNWSDEMLVFSW